MADDMSIQEIRLRSVLGPESIQTPGGPAGQPVPGAADAEGPSFTDVLKDSINEVNRLQMEAEKAQADLITGENRDIHSAVIAMQKAGVSFKLMMEVRNKITDAYREVMRMQV